LRDEDKIKIFIVVDNTSYRNDFESAWGLSLYVEAYKHSFLFDTGPDPGVFRRNLEKTDIDLRSIDFVVISHCHKDHTGGLEYIAERRPGLQIYIPDESRRHYIQEIGLRPSVIKDLTKISENIFITKPLEGPPIEQSLVIKNDDKMILLVGCSHPGITNIVREVVYIFKKSPEIIIGGLHLFNVSTERVKEIVEELISIGVKKIFPIHCSGEKTREYIKTNYPEIYGDGGAGMIIEL